MAQLRPFVILCFTVALLRCSAAESDSQNLENAADKAKGGGCASDYLILRSLEKMASKINILKQTVDEYGLKQTKLLSYFDTLVASQKEQNSKIAHLSRMVNSTNNLVRNQGYGAGRWVFHVKSTSGHYKFSYSDAVSACKAHGAKLATRAQLTVAQKLGMAQCSCGWLADRTVYYPTQYPIVGGCGHHGLNSCRGRYQADAFCFFFHYDGPISVTY